MIDDDASVRRAVRRLVESVGLRAEAMGSATEFLRISRPDAPSCIILDVRLPDMSGLQLQSELAASGTPIPVIFITAYGDIPMTVRAMRSGAIEFLPKPFRDQDLLDAVQIALEKDRLRRRLNAEVSVLRDRFKSLTSREREIFPLVVSGLANKQIAALVEVSEATVKVHRSQLTRKMGARSLPDLVRIAEKIGIPSTDARGA